MARFTVLFADDELDQYPVLTDAVTALESVGYDVKTAQTLKKALDLVRKTHFDFAIVDLGWQRDHAIPSGKRVSTGWDICDAIDEENRRSAEPPTLQIMLSRQFAYTPRACDTAAKRGVFPLFKRTDAKGQGQALVAAVRFMEEKLRRPDELLFNAVTQSWNEALVQLKLWFRLTVTLFALGVGILLSGIAGAFFWNVQVGTITAVSGIVTSGVSSLLFRQLTEARKSSGEKLLEIYKLVRRAPGPRERNSPL
ncbi:MAG: hypothetical protein ACE5I4_01720 [Thermoplasmata archaeon]